MISYIIWNVDPEIFTIPYFDHPVRWYGLSWALGFLFSQQVMYFIYKKEGRPSKEVDILTIYLVLSAILGARLGHFIFYEPSILLTDPMQVFLPPYAGLASHGGAIGTLIALVFFVRKTNVKYLWITDRLVIAAALIGCFIRLGNLMNSEIIGLPTELPWGFIFTSYDRFPRHPTQLYEAIYCFILFVSLFAIWKKKLSTLHNGILTGWFLVILFTLRFFDEFLKLNQVTFEADMMLNMGQILSIPFVLLGLVILVYAYRKNGEEGVDVESQTPPSFEEREGFTKGL